MSKYFGHISLCTKLCSDWKVEIVEMSIMPTLCISKHVCLQILSEQILEMISNIKQNVGEHQTIFSPFESGQETISA